MAQVRRFQCTVQGCASFWDLGVKGDEISKIMSSHENQTPCFKSGYKKKHNTSEEHRTTFPRNHMPTASSEAPSLPPPHSTPTRSGTSWPKGLNLHLSWWRPFLPLSRASCLIRGFSKHSVFTKDIVGRYSNPILQKEKLRLKSQEFVLGDRLKSRARNLIPIPSQISFASYISWTHWQLVFHWLQVSR